MKFLITLLLLSTLMLGSFSLHAQSLYVPNGTGGIGGSMNGNVGVGTNYPDKKLSVLGDVRLGSQGLGGGVPRNGILVQTNGTRTELRWQHFGQSINPYLAVDPGVNSTALIFGTNGSDRMVLSSHGYLGIGTNNPGTMLEVNGNVNVGSNNATETGYGNRLYFAGVKRHTDDLWISRYNVDNAVSELRVNIGDDKGDKFVIGCHYWNGGAWTPTMTVQTNGKVGIGTSNPDAPLTVAGNIHAREIKVTATAGGADFVFADDYSLPKLEAVAAFVKQNKHLPEIPSAAEMEANGLHLAEMNIKLLQKVEELTLYTIEQEKKLATQEQKAAERDQLIQQLMKRMEKLEENQ